jgi:hypothetical protein
VRGVWRRIGPRYGVSLGLIFVVIAVVLIARVGAHPARSNLVQGAAPAVTGATSEPPDDADVSLPPTALPTVPPSGPDAAAVATSFAKAWLHHDGVTATQWRAGIIRYTTDHLATQFTDVDPGSVPADTMTGPAVATNHSPSFVEMSVPTDQGALVLGLRFENGKWLVDSVDWDAS